MTRDLERRPTGRPDPGGPLETLCRSCQRQAPVSLSVHRCPCGGTIELAPAPALPGPGIRRLRGETVWRWREALRLPEATVPLTRGEGDVPLERATVGGREVRLAREDRNPSGSCKDRGLATLVSARVALGARRLVVASPGNGAVSTALYGAAAGIPVRAVVPDSLPDGKREAILAAGAEVRLVPGGRAERSSRAREDAKGEGTVLVETGDDPFYLEGQKTLAYQIHERLGGHLPGLVVLPVARGSLLRGLYRGFADLVHHGLSERLPRLLGVRCNPPTVAEMEAGDPELLRLAEDSAKVSGGGIVEVSPVELDVSLRHQWWEGRFLEEAAVAPVAWYEREARRGSLPSETALLVLTGAGTRAGRPVADLPTGP